MSCNGGSVALHPPYASRASRASVASCSGCFTPQQPWHHNLSFTSSLWDCTKLKSSARSYRRPYIKYHTFRRLLAWSDDTPVAVTHSSNASNISGQVEEGNGHSTCGGPPVMEMDTLEAEVQENCEWESSSIEELLQQMLGLSPSEDFLQKCVYIVRRCKSTANLEYAKVAHVYLCATGLDMHRRLGSYLIAMFVECGGLPFAQHVFNKLEHRNQFSWTYIIQGYILNGEPQHGLYLFLRMQDDRVQPSIYTFVAVLNACMRLKLPGRGQDIHTQIVEEELEKNLLVAYALLDYYTRCGLIHDAIDVFNDLQDHDSFLRNSATVGELHEDSCLESMHLDGVSLDIVTFIYSLKACGSVADLRKGREIHNEIIKGGFENTLYIGNTLVDVYAKCGSLVEARWILDKLPIRDVISWTAMIVGYTDHGLCKEALQCYDKMEHDGMFPNSFTVCCILRASGSRLAIDRGRKLHMEIIYKGLDLDFVVCNALVDMYSKCGLLAEAQEVFDKLVYRDVIAWTALMAGYADYGPLQKSLMCLQQMQSEGFSPTPATFVCGLKSCTILKTLSTGQGLHADVVARGYERLDIVGNCLIGLYVKCGAFRDAWAVFDSLPSPDVVAWTVLIEGYSEHGHGMEALDSLDKMQQDGVCPNAVTFACSLKACGTLGSVDKVHKLHGEIVKRGFEKDRFIRKALVDMYAECGKLFDIDSPKRVSATI